jgi:hypothetical protein
VALQAGGRSRPPFNTRNRPPRRTRRRTKTGGRRCPGRITRPSMRTCRCRARSRNCSSIFNDTNRKRSTSILSSSHSFPSTFLQSARSTHS